MNNNLVKKFRINKVLNDLGIEYMKNKCIEIDIYNLYDDDKTENDIIEFYNNIDNNKLKRIYLKYFGIKGLTD